MYYIGIYGYILCIGHTLNSIIIFFKITQNFTNTSTEILLTLHHGISAFLLITLYTVNPKPAAFLKWNNSSSSFETVNYYFRDIKMRT